MLPKSMSESMALLQPESILKSMPHVATRAHAGAWDLGHNLCCWNLGIMLQPGTYISEWLVLPHRAMVSSLVGVAAEGHV